MIKQDEEKGRRDKTLVKRRSVAAGHCDQAGRFSHDAFGRCTATHPKANFQGRLRPPPRTRPPCPLFAISRTAHYQPGRARR